MNIENTIAAILEIPNQFRTLGNRKLQDLLADSGYLNYYPEVTEGRIREALLGRQDCVRQWLEYSADKRCDSGWFIEPTGDGKYVVGYLDKGGRRTHEDTYADAEAAAAAFIKRELEHLRQGMGLRRKD